MKTKKIATVILSSIMTIAMGTSSFAAGWQKNEVGWRYATDADNSMWYTNSWQWIDGNHDGISECYYFDNNGYTLSSTAAPDGYEVNADGAWILNGIVQTGKAETNSGYTKKINNTIWDLMDHTYAENNQKYGKYASDRHGSLPYDMYYYTGFLPEEEIGDFKPYFIVANSQDIALNAVFEDAPDINIYTDIESIGDYLEDLGYTVLWGKTNLGMTDTCWITVDRFDIAFVKSANESFEIKVRQKMSEKSIKAMQDAIGAQTSA